MKREWGILFLSIFLISLVSAHQPRIVLDIVSNESSSIQISNPEISQAFYGNLKGTPDYYEITSNSQFLLYLNVLSPAIANSSKDFQVLITKDGKYFNTLYSAPENWTEFYEEFGGDNYYRGPEMEMNVSAGRYQIIVSNPRNSGKYSLAVGKIEAFPPKESFNAFLAMPVLKTRFFEKSIFLSYYNRIGLFSLGALVVLIIFILLLVLLIKRISKKRKKK